jgi:hypothetical protein
MFAKKEQLRGLLRIAAAADLKARKPVKRELTQR